MTAYWAEHPPVHILVAAFVGHKPKTEKDNNPQEVAALFDMLRPVQRS